MKRCLTALLLCACAAPAWPQLPGQKGGFGSTDSRSGRDVLISPSNPGVAPPLDIRIQDEGISLPRGVSEDERDQKPAEPPRPQAEPPKSAPPAPDARKP